MVSLVLRGLIAMLIRVFREVVVAILILEKYGRHQVYVSWCI